MNKNELVRVVVDYDANDDFDVSRQTVFISKEEFETKKVIPIKIKSKNKVKSIKVELVKK
jgi:hypothetical protein